MNRKEKILIIEDVESSRAALKAALGKGYKFFEAETGEEGLRILQEEKSMDLILLDLFMPGIPGIEFLELIKAGGAFSQIPVIVCTADEDEKTEEEALRMGAEDYLIKPFKPTVVKQRVVNTLRRRSLEMRVKKYKVNQEIQELVDNLPVGVGIFEIGQKEMRPTCVNRKAKELFKYESGSWDMFRDKDKAFVELDRHDLNRIMTGGKEVVIHRIFQAHSSDGKAFKIKAIAKMCPNKNGTMTCYATIDNVSEE